MRKFFLMLAVAGAGSLAALTVQAGDLSATTAPTVSTAGLAALATPAPPCPAKWRHLPAGAVIPGFDQGAIANLDHNGNGMVCIKIPPAFCRTANQTDPGNGAQCGSWVVKDDHI